MLISAKTTKSIFGNTRHYFGDSFIFNIHAQFSAQTVPYPNLHSTHRSPTINFFTLLGRSLKSSHYAADDVITCSVLLPACLLAYVPITSLQKSTFKDEQTSHGCTNLSCLSLPNLLLKT
jgi:hypothetical protein